MKVLKKIITFLMLGIIFFPLNSVSASANSNVAMTVISEYDMYKQIKETSVNDLLTAGYSEATIKEYKETDYVGVLFKRAELSKDELINLGYTDDQIEIFQNFTGTEDEINTLSASLTFSLSYVRSSISNNSTWCDVKVSWSWSQCPIFTQEDIVALAWTDGMYCDTSSAVNSTYYLWYSKSNNAYVNGSYGDITAVLNTGVYTQKDIVPLGYDTYLRSGTMSIRVQKQAKVNELSFLAKYGHNQLGFSPSVDISADGPSLGISFDWYLADEAISDLYVNLNNPPK